MNKCQNCRFHENDNRKLNIEGPVRPGDYCVKFAWNLNKVEKVPGDCYVQK